MLELITKSIDEGRQGEAFQGDRVTNNNYSKHFYIESYGCQMNFSDSEIIASILQGEGFGPTRNVEEANLIFLNTCSIREKAELTVRKRLTEFKKIKKQNPLTGVPCEFQFFIKSSIMSSNCKASDSVNNLLDWYIQTLD